MHDLESGHGQLYEREREREREEEGEETNSRQSMGMFIISEQPP